jgi:hypothetical protein
MGSHVKGSIPPAGKPDGVGETKEVKEILLLDRLGEPGLYS